MGNVRPLHDRLAVEVIERKETTESGLIIPSSARPEVTQKGIVTAVGTGKIVNGKVIPIDVKAGDAIIFTLSTARRSTEVEIDGKKCIIIDEQEILAVLELDAPRSDKE